MTRKLKTALGFCIGITFILILKDCIHWATSDVSAKEKLIAVSASLVAGLATGLLMTWIVGKIQGSHVVPQPPQFEFQMRETLQLQSPANHLKGLEAVGGFLYLTNNRLFFKSHKLNIQNHELSINLSQLDAVSRRKSLGLINNGIAVRLTNGDTERFLVTEADKWVEFIEINSNRHATEK